MCAGTESDSVMALVGRIVCLQAIDHCLLGCSVHFFCKPEHTAGGLFDKYCGNLACFRGNHEGSFVVDVNLIKEFHAAGGLVDQHKADVGSLSGIEGNGRIVYIKSFLDGRFYIYGEGAFVITDEGLGSLSVAGGVNVYISFKVLSTFHNYGVGGLVVFCQSDIGESISTVSVIGQNHFSCLGSACDTAYSIYIIISINDFGGKVVLFAGLNDIESHVGNIGVIVSICVSVVYVIRSFVQYVDIQCFEDYLVSQNCVGSL